MTGTPRERLPGSVPATVAAGLTFATAVVYVAVIVTQEENEIGRAIVVTTFIAGLGVAALAGAMRAGPDRVIPLGIASGGLVGAAVVSLSRSGCCSSSPGSSLSWRGRERGWGPHPAISCSEGSGVRSPRSCSSCS